jgi:uncharacterized protein (TIGR03066 family)
MNAKRCLAATAIVCLVSVGAWAEEKTDKAKLLVGSWEVIKADEGTLPPGSVVEFTKDGKLKVTVKAGDQDMTLEGTYKLEGDKFDIKFNDQEQTLTITIKKLTKTELSTTNPEGKAVDLKRKK